MTDSLTYLSYYFPILSWLPNYNFKQNIIGDLIAGFSLASFQIPLVISFSTLAHVDVKNGLYGIIVSPVVYSILGSCSYLITGPEAAVSLIVGSSIEALLHNNTKNLTFIEVLSALTLTSGLVLLFSGLFRFGFLGNVVSQGLLNGFISAIGILMIVTELLTQLGLAQFFEEMHEVDPSTIDKLRFIVSNLDLVHSLTAKISAVAFAALFVTRHAKKQLIKRNPKRFGRLNFFPEILMVVIISIILSSHYHWDKEGVTIIGKYFDQGQQQKDSFIVNTNKHNKHSDLHLPVTWQNLRLLKKCFSTAFICSVLGFFESSTATKALENQLNVDFSLNRELVALGACNIVGSFFSMLPCFGGYGRSKINSLTAKTQLSGIILSLITLIFYVFFLNIFYYLPECILACIISSVGLSLIEESPENLKFYWRIKGYDEIGIFFLIVLSTLFWSPEIGISLGIGLSVIKVIKFSTRTKIQILGRVPKTNIFRNADEFIEENFDVLRSRFKNNSGIYSGVTTGGVTTSPVTPGIGGIDTTNDDLESGLDDVVNQLENIEHCLVVKITEPLIFANSNELKLRLKRVEKYGSLNIHPSQPTLLGNDKIKYIIIDCKNMTLLDSSATLTLYEIVLNYYKHDFIILFSRIPFDLKLRKNLVDSGIAKIVKKALEKHGGLLFSNSIISNNNLTGSIGQSATAFSPTTVPPTALANTNAKTTTTASTVAALLSAHNNNGINSNSNVTLLPSLRHANSAAMVLDYSDGNSGIHSFPNPTGSSSSRKNSNSNNNNGIGALSPGGADGGIGNGASGNGNKNDLEYLLPTNSTTNYSIGLGDGFYTSIDDALRVVSECEARKNRINSKRAYI